MEQCMRITLTARLSPIELEDGELRRHNHRAIRWTLIALKHGRTNAIVGGAIMHEAYRAAWSAYHTTRSLGRSEEEARYSARVHAEIPLEKHMGVLAETDYAMSCDDALLTRLTRKWLGTRS
jgi:hypothetical protein